MSAFRASRRIVAALLPLLAVLALASWAQAASPWWRLGQSVTPSSLSSSSAPPVCFKAGLSGGGRYGESQCTVLAGPGGGDFEKASGQIVLTLSNLGDAPADAKSVPVRIADILPAGLTATAIEGTVVGGARPPLHCEVASVTCVFNEAALAPYTVLKVWIAVQVQPGAGEREANQVNVSGAGAPPLTLDRPLTVSETPAPFGLQENDLAFEGGTAAPSGAPDTRAGSHPFQVTSILVFNQLFQPSEAGGLGPAPVALPNHVAVKLPTGFLGNPQSLARCTIGQFLTKTKGNSQDACTAQTAVGVATVTVDDPTNFVLTFTVPIFNLEPGFGEPARFGFYNPTTETPVFLDAAERGGGGVGSESHEEYAVTVGSSGTTQTVGVLESRLTFWGVPGDPRHDANRGWSGGSAGTTHPSAFLTMPTSCSGAPLLGEAELDSWAEPKPPGQRLLVANTEEMPTLNGCNQLSFSPLFEAKPTTASAASGPGWMSIWTFTMRASWPPKVPRSPS